MWAKCLKSLIVTEASTTSGRRQQHRDGKMLVMFGICVPAIFGIVGLVFDMGLHSIDNQNLKQAADAAATAGMLALQQGQTAAQATATAQACVQSWNGLGDATVTINISGSDLWKDSVAIQSRGFLPHGIATVAVDKPGVADAPVPVIVNVAS